MGMNRFKRDRDTLARGYYVKQMEILRAEKHLYWRTMSALMLTAHAEDAFNKATRFRKYKALRFFGKSKRDSLRIAFQRP